MFGIRVFFTKLALLHVVERRENTFKLPGGALTEIILIPKEFGPSTYEEVKDKPET